MEFDPEKTLAYLSGKTDEYVKQQARDTLVRNAEADKKARYARIPDGMACDFCKMLGSRGFIYHSEEKAGGVAHGTKWDTYHPYCNCQIAVTFDPIFEEYYVGLTKVRRGFALDAQVTVPGRDGADALRQVDIDELFGEYKAMGKEFSSTAKLHRSPNDYRAGGTLLLDDQYAEAMARLASAKDLDELHAIGKEIVDNWPANKYGRNPAQWRELSELAQELERGMIEDASSRFAKGLDDWGGSFGKKLEPVRKRYRESDDVERSFNDCWGTSTEFGRFVKELPEDKRTALVSGIDKGMQVVGQQARKIVAVDIGEFEDKETLGSMVRREGDVGVMKLSPRVFEEMTLDQIEQIAFHEVAHTAEWKYTTYEEWAAEQDALLRWRHEGGDLEKTKSTAVLDGVLTENAVEHFYDAEDGMIIISGEDSFLVRDISAYAVDGACDGVQDSELIAEAIRHKAVHPRSRNKVVTSITGSFL